MQYQDYSKDINRYQLSEDYALIRADSDNTDFVHHWTAYRPNEEYHQDWTQRYSDLLGVPFCFWIMKQEKRIGGCLLLPNILAELFLVPPFEDYSVVLEQVVPLLKHWSDSTKTISARYVLPEQLTALSQLGFVVEEQRRWMIRPTTSSVVTFEHLYALSQPNLDEAEQYADVFFAAFSGGIGAYGQRDKTQHLKSIENTFESNALLDASLVVKDSDTGDIATICLMSDYGGHASINFVVTHPDYQKRGLGHKAMQYALNAVYGNYPWTILAVTIGNPAEKLYHEMGFQRGIEISTMILE